MCRRSSVTARPLTRQTSTPYFPRFDELDRALIIARLTSCARFECLISVSNQVDSLARSQNVMKA